MPRTSAVKSVRLPNDAWNELERIAADKKIPMNRLLRESIESANPEAFKKNQG